MRKKLMHIPIKYGSIAPYALLPGDPGRVDLIGGYLKNFRILGQNREFRIGTGTYQGIAITVCSTGIGCPSTAIAAEELIFAGAKTLIRVGTCGGAWRSDIPAGSLIIPTSSVRDEGTTAEYIPIGFPAVADFEVVASLVRSAQEKKYRYFSGVNRTHDAFYGSQTAITKWGAYLTEERWKNCDTPILSSDMETSALLVIASLRGVRAGAVLAANAKPENLKSRMRGDKQRMVAESSPELTTETVDKAIRTALGALTIMAHSGKT